MTAHPAADRWPALLGNQNGDVEPSCQASSTPPQNAPISITHNK